MLDSKRGGRVALRVEIDNEHSESAKRECGGQVHTRRGLADAALLVCDDEDAGVCRRWQ